MQTLKINEIIYNKICLEHSKNTTVVMQPLNVHCKLISSKFHNGNKNQ